MMCYYLNVQFQGQSVNDFIAVVLLSGKVPYIYRERCTKPGRQIVRRTKLPTVVPDTYGFSDEICFVSPFLRLELGILWLLDLPISTVATTDKAVFKSCDLGLNCMSNSHSLQFVITGVLISP